MFFSYLLRQGHIDEAKTWKCQTIREKIPGVDCSKCKYEDRAHNVTEHNGTEPVIKAEIEPGVFVISDYHDDKWYSSVIKDGEPAEQEVPSKKVLWVTDETRDRALKANMGVLEIGTRETRSQLLITAISGISSTARQQIIANWKAAAKAAEPQPDREKTLEEKYPPEILEKANEILNDGDPFRFMLSVWGRAT